MVSSGVNTHLGSFLQQRGHQRRVLAAGAALRASAAAAAAAVVGSLQHRAVLHQEVHLAAEQAGEQACVVKEFTDASHTQHVLSH